MTLRWRRRQFVLNFFLVDVPAKHGHGVVPSLPDEDLHMEFALPWIHLLCRVYTCVNHTQY